VIFSVLELQQYSIALSAPLSSSACQIFVVFVFVRIKHYMRMHCSACAKNLTSSQLNLLRLTVKQKVTVWTVNRK